MTVYEGELFYSVEKFDAKKQWRSGADGGEISRYVPARKTKAHADKFHMWALINEKDGSYADISIYSTSAPKLKPQTLEAA